MENTKYKSFKKILTQPERNFRYGLQIIWRPQTKDKRQSFRIWQDVELNWIWSNVSIFGQVGFYFKSRDDFDFPIVSFPFMCSNIQTAAAYRVCISQLIRYPMACAPYQDFINRGLFLTRKLLGEEFSSKDLSLNAEMFSVI